MTATEKIDFVKNMIREKAEISPAGPFCIDLFDVLNIEANGGIPDEAPVLMWISEEKSIIKKLEEEEFIKNVQWDKENKRKVWLEIIKNEKDEENSCYSASYGYGIGYIKSVDDILVDIPLRNVCLKIIERFGKLKRGHTYATDVIETDEQGSYQPYELILLFKELGLVEKIDRAGFYNQTEYKKVGNRRLEFTLNADKVLDFVDRTNGKNSVIRKQALEFIAHHIASLKSGIALVDFLKDLGVPDTLIVYPQTKWKMIFDVLLYYSSCPNFENRKILYTIIEQAAHPLMHNGDKIAAEETRKRFNGFLEYDNFSIDMDRTLWHECKETGESYDKNGHTFDVPVYIILPKKINKLYLYWNELIKLTTFYLKNKDTHDEEINIIYFEIIENIEDILQSNDCGILKEIYKRPFGHILGCEFELKKQNLTEDALLVNLYDFLGKITEYSLPKIENLEKLKQENSSFFKKLDAYYKKHSEEKNNQKEIENSSAFITPQFPPKINGKNPYQSLIDVIDVLLKKIEITPKNRLTGNEIKIHVSETPLPQNRLGVEELGQILNTIKNLGSLTLINQNFASFAITEPNKELLLKEKEKWLRMGGDEEQSVQKIEITKLPELEIKETETKKVILKKEPVVLIKNARLDGQNYLLEINGGDKIISFKSKKKGNGFEKETKQFKILYHLWDFHWEIKNGKIINKGDFASLNNLTTSSGSESTEATYKHIQRLNDRFKKEGVAIEITGENEKYRLIINKG